MAVNTNLTIIWTEDFDDTETGDTVGGNSDVYQIHGPYVIDKSFTTLRLVFDVVVVATSTSDLYTKSTALETAFTQRGRNLRITIGSDSWSYREGTEALNMSSSLSKSGSQDTDRGNSRAYTIVIEGDVAMTSGGGIRDIEFTVDYEPSRRLSISMQGVYTRTSDGTASANYLDTSDGADSQATTFINAVKTQTRNGSSTTLAFELVDEQYTYDRLDNTCQFSRQYSELLVNQSVGSLDHAKIKDHRLTFTDMSKFMSQSREDISGMRRVAASFDCSLDVSQTTNTKDTVDNVIRPHLDALFLSTFNADVICIEDERHSFDESAKRLSVSVQYIYLPGAAVDGQIIEVSESVAYREQRTLDTTPMHGTDEFSAEIAVGWATLERISTRSMMITGNKQKPRRRLGPKGTIDTGDFKMKIAHDGRLSKMVVRQGWNLVSSSSQVTDQWLGDPESKTQIGVQVLVESVVERCNTAPGATNVGGGGNTGGRDGASTTPGGGRGKGGSQ